jgi:hypothetical protein
MNNISVIGKFKRLDVLEEVKEVERYHSLVDIDQYCLQTVDGEQDPLYGSRGGDEIAIGDTEKDFVHPLFDMPYTNKLIKKYNLYRTRIMKLPVKFCLTWHKDPTSRIHFPLLSNDDFFFIIEDEMVRMKMEDVVYKMNTTKFHTAVNASTETRVHMIGTVL